MYKLRHLILGISLLISTHTNADPTTWTGTTDNQWRTANNWSNGVPGTGQTAILGAQQNQNLNITNGGGLSVGEIQVNQSGFSLTNNISGFGTDFIINGLGITGNSPFTLTNNGNMEFTNSSTIGQATLINKSICRFSNSANPGKMASIVNDSSIVLINNILPIIEMGSLSGSSTGTISTSFIDKNLHVGHLNRNETYAGKFNDGLTVLSLTKQGTGTFIVTNTAHTYTGTTTVNDGTLQWDGGFAGSASEFTINPMGVLTGVGRVGSLINHGLVAPGNPANPYGLLFVDFYSSPTQGTLRFNVAPTQNSSFTTSTGADVKKTICNLNFAPGRYQQAQHVLIRSFFAGNIVGPFLSITGTPVRLKTNATFINLVAGQKRVVLNTTERPFIDVLSTFFSNASSDAISLAGALDAAANNPNLGTDFNSIIGLFNVLPQNEFLAALDNVGSDHFNMQPWSDLNNMNDILSLTNSYGSWNSSPDLKFAATSMSPAPVRDSIASTQFTRTKFDACGPVAHKGKSFEEIVHNLKHTQGNHMQAPVHQLLSHNPGKGHIWVEGFGGRADAEKTNEDFGFRSSSAGAMLGFDYAVAKDVRLGVGGGYSQSNMKINNNMGHSKAESPFASLWGSYAWDLYDVDFGVTAKRNRIHNYRNIKFSTLSRTAKARYHSTDWMPHLGAAYNIWAHDSALHIKPFVGFDVFYTRAQAFTETDANSLNLAVKARTSSALQSSIGIGFDRHIHRCNGTFTPELQVKYMNRSAIKRPRTQANFVNQNALFVSTADKKTQHRMGMKAELGYAWHHGGTFKVGYHGDYGKGQKAHMGMISLGKSW